MEERMEEERLRKFGIKEEMPEAMKSRWMWVARGEKMASDVPQLVYFRKVFQASAGIASRIRISADSRYKLYVNGKLAEIGPCKGDRFVWYYDEIELEPYLIEGTNVLAVEVLRYPMSGNGCHGIYRTAFPGLYVEEVVSENGKKIGVDGNGGWRYRIAGGFRIVPESLSFAPLQILEERSAERENHGWRESGYDDSGWSLASPRMAFEMHSAVSPGNLMPRPIPYMRREDCKFQDVVCLRSSRLPQKAWKCFLTGGKEIAIPADNHESIEIDAGEETTGYLSLRIFKGKGSKVKILQSECYVTEDRNKRKPQMPVKGNRIDWNNGHLEGFTDTFYPAGCGTEEKPEIYEPFWFRTFRYIRLEIETGEEELVLKGFDYQKTGYPLEVKAHVYTSDETLLPVWDISLRTLRNCMHETYEDCPFYEQLQYAMDSRSQILYTYMVAADDRLARRCMEDFKRSQRHDGMLNCSAPNYGPNIIPGFSIYYILMLHDHMMYFGDREFLRGHMGCMDSILEYFRRHVDGRGLVGKTGGMNSSALEPYWSFIDWTPQWDATTGMPAAGLEGPITMESFLYIMGLDHAADILDYLGRKDTAAEYRERARQVRAALNTFCVDEDGVYQDGPGICQYSQHCQVFAVLTDTVPVEKGRKLLEKTLDEQNHYAQCSVAMAYYLFRALEKTGLYERTEKLWDLWRDMVTKNLTTCVEDGVDERSDCHGWGALALYELPAAVLGVRPGAPGFERIMISPVPGYLKWARGCAATKWGVVDVSWERDAEGRIDIAYKVPDGVEVVVPQ